MTTSFIRIAVAICGVLAAGCALLSVGSDLTDREEWDHKLRIGTDRTSVETDLVDKLWDFHRKVVAGYLEAPDGISAGEMVASAKALDVIAGTDLAAYYRGHWGPAGASDIEHVLEQWDAWFLQNSDDLYFEPLAGRPVRKQLCQEEHFPDNPATHMLDRREAPLFQAVFSHHGKAVRLLLFESGVLRVERLGYRIWCSVIQVRREEALQLAAATQEALGRVEPAEDPSCLFWVETEAGSQGTDLRHLGSDERTRVADLLNIFWEAGFPKEVILGTGACSL